MSHKLDQIISALRFGKYQLKNYLLISGLMIFYPFQMLIIPFLTHPHLKKCYGLNSNLNLELLDDNLSNDNISTYMDRNYSIKYLAINIRNDPSLVSQISFIAKTGKNITTTLGLQYFDLTEDRTYLITQASSIFMAGSVIGCFVFALISDKFGRKRSLLLSNFTLFFSTILTCVWTPHFYVFLVYRFIQGVCHSGNFMAHMIFLIELIPSNKRHYLSLVSTALYTLGHIILSSLAYALPYWKHLQLATALFIGVFSFVIVLADESIPWLVSRNRTREATLLIEKAAQWNKLMDIEFFQHSNILKILMELNNINQPVHTYDNSDEDMKNQEELLNNSVMIVQVKNTDKCPKRNMVQKICKIKFIYILRVPILLKRTILAALSTVFIYQLHMTLMFSFDLLPGNMYINFVFMGISGMPGNLMGFYALKIGRRKPIVLFNAVTALTILIRWTLYYSNNPIDSINIALFLVGKTFISAALAVTFPYISELYPTKIRNIGYGFNNALNRCGVVTAPLIASLVFYLI
ncbi:unnamed protein product [Gordionus sp. m RMFG-2023]